jgi:hypothetical protein
MKQGRHLPALAALALVMGIGSRAEAADRSPIVPEPTTAAFLLVGLAALGGVVRKKLH